MKIPLAKLIFSEEMKEAAISALEDEWYVLGESVLKFEVEARVAKQRARKT